MDAFQILIHLKHQVFWPSEDFLKSIFVLVSGHNGGDEGGNDNGHGHSQGQSRPGGFGSHNVPVRPQTDDACQNAVPRCDISAQYRNITGACNNIKNQMFYHCELEAL